MNEPHKPAGAIFDAALELPPERRPAYLREACGGDDSLRQRVEALLRAHQSAQAFMDHPAVDLRREPLVVQPAEQPGDKIGRYKLLQQIGEGGCGVVYMAEQEEPVHRRVALKVIKLGMDTKNVIARFEAERQALALMDHPNIAKVLDAGATDTGRPYFVMELVRGVKITDYCDQNSLSTPERLDLFIQICRAIQHAHQKGIIHRDIKPSNILVTVNDGVPVPKVIDFGIAKATEGRLTDQTLFTAFEQFLGTPAYMSPEQAVMTSVDIDTRSDIYSLGVLLYELLTGQTPFDAKELLQAGLDEIRRTIREQEPARPSNRLSTMLGAELTAIAQHRKVEPPRLIHLVRGDLDWIVMKALEKDRGRRYDTANGLAMDVQRFLRNEPVTAAAPRAGYKLRKFVRRHKAVLATVTALMALLAAGVVASTWEAVRARRAERAQHLSRLEAQADGKKAKAEAAKSQQVAAFLQAMLQGVDPAEAAGLDTTLLRKILDKTGARIGAALKDQPEVEAELLHTIGFVYARIGETAKAEATYRDALAIERKLVGSGRSDLALSLSDLLLDLAYALNQQGKLAEGETFIRESLAMRRKLFGAEHLSIATSLSDLAETLVAQGKLAEAEALQQDALAMRRKVAGNQSWDVAMSLRCFGHIRRGQGRLAEAEAFTCEEVSVLRKVYGNEHLDVAYSLNNLADVLTDEGNLAEAETLDREALAIQRKLYHNEGPQLASTLGNLSHILSKEGKLPEAEAVSRELLRVQGKLLGSGDPSVIESLNTLVGLLLAQHKDVEAEQLLGDLLKQAPEGQPQSVAVLRARITFFGRRGRWNEAAADLSKLVELDAANDYEAFKLTVLLVGIGDMANYRAHCQRMAARFGAGKDPGSLDKTAKAGLLVPAAGLDLEAACQMADQAVTLGKDSPFVYYFQLVKGLAEYRAGHFASAVNWVGKSMGKPATVGGLSPAWNRDVAACSVQAMAQYKLKRSDEARAALARGVAIAQTNLPQRDSGDLGEDWADWLVAHILLREAQALIEAPSAPVAESSVPK